MLLIHDYFSVDTAHFRCLSIAAAAALSMPLRYADTTFAAFDAIIHFFSLILPLFACTPSLISSMLAESPCHTLTLPPRRLRSLLIFRSYCSARHARRAL